MRRISKWTFEKPSRHRYRAAFTLLELLVVIAIIALLAALLLPALAGAKQQARSIACLSNLKQLELCCHLYTLDNQDFLVLNQAGGFVTLTTSGTNSPQAIVNIQSWCPGLAPYDTNATNVESGLIFQYSRSTAIYHCPADNSTVLGYPGLSRTRSYCMDLYLNSSSAQNSYHKFSEIRQPSPAETFALIDTQEGDIFDATFGIFPSQSPWANYWLDLAADRHSRGANLSFVDGHVEHWHWKAPKIFVSPFWPASSPGDLDDLHRLEAGVKAGAD
jgi:prepilin-type processing-associated H-X9-DG protein/prepilin-type N-terminal cleavage/methylation domain-containing protein